MNARERQRTAPTSWGPWPPSQERINVVFERAVRKLAEAIEARGAPERIILMAQPKGPIELDSHFTGRESEVVIGHIRGIGAHKGWTVYWNPARDKGRLEAIGYFDWQS